MLLTILVAVLFSLNSFAAKNDIELVFPHSDEFFAPDENFLVLPKAFGLLTLSRYIVSDVFHKWQGGAKGDVLFLQLKPALLHSSLAIETLADERNPIYFRLVQLYYDIFTAIEWKVPVGILYTGYRHRCSHGADAAVDSRILIRSGPELGYRAGFSVDQFSFESVSFAHLSLFSQNQDPHFHPRFLAATALQVDWQITALFGLHGAAGIGVGVVSDSDLPNVNLISPWSKLRAIPLPTARLGFGIHSDDVSALFSFAYQKNLDSGLTKFANAPDPLLFRMDFSW